MPVLQRSRAVTLAVALSLPAACTSDAPEGGELDEADRGSEEVQADTVVTDTTQVTTSSRVALPGLFGIMVGLQEDMARISRGLWLEDFDTVAAAADAVADHPRVPPEEFQGISAALGQDMSLFGGMDTEVHDIAVRLGERARDGDLDGVLEADGELRRACVACHSAFRDRLREQIR